MKVTLREKKLKNGDLSLYLDFWPPIIHPIKKTKTRREFLKLRISAKPKTRTERKHNKDTKALAEQIRAQRQLALQAGNYDFLKKKQGEKSFYDFIDQQIEEKKGTKSKSTVRTWESMLALLKRYQDKECRFDDLTEGFVKGFKDFLDTTHTLRSKTRKLSPNTKYNYFSKFKSAINSALAQKLLNDNPLLNVKGFKVVETQREFLSLDELKLLFQTDCEIPILKQAALFSALTGLRWSDISNLTWDKIGHSEELGHYVRFKQQKTQNYQNHSISDQACELLGTRSDSTSPIFEGLSYSAWTNLKLKQWVLKAGIAKEITFHCFRHTYATLQLALGTDIYTVSKLLGHKNVKTTQNYAKIVDEKKKEAANRIPRLDL